MDLLNGICQQNMPIPLIRARLTTFGMSTNGGITKMKKLTKPVFRTCLRQVGIFAKFNIVDVVTTMLMYTHLYLIVAMVQLLDLVVSMVNLQIW